MLPSLPHILVRDCVKLALIEDLGRAGDITSQAVIEPQQKATALLVARKAGVICGLDLAAETVSHFDDLNFTPSIADGAFVPAGTALAQVSGGARSLLSAERVMLNFMTHLSGIASLTARYVAAVSHTQARITCTRKTTPGLRALEKYAVRCGGGINHRFGLDDALLIKDNHIAVAGSVTAALQRAKKAVGHLVKIEIEVDSLAQLDEVLREGADVVMCDNMDVPTLKEAVKRVNHQLVVEASGGVNLETVAAIAETGVSVISVGALTHSAPALDLALDITLS